VALGTGSAWGYTAPSIPASCITGTATCQTVALSGVSTAGDNIAARAVFEVSGSSLFITLSNTSLFDVSANGSVLTALLFDLNYTNGDAVTLNPLSALITTTAGSSISFDADTVYNNAGSPALDSTCAGTVTGTNTCTIGNNVGGEWEYETIAYNGFTKGISSTGLGGIFGSGTMFPGKNLSGPANVDGPQYGITTAADNFATGNPNSPLTVDTVQFKLGITNQNGRTLALNSSGALSAGFQYGTSQGDTLLVPAPGTLALFGLGVVVLGWTRRRATH
jgi:hypothetical protein